MLPSERLNAYCSLLKIRQTAYRRKALLTGAAMILVLLATLAYGLLNPGYSPTMMIMSGFSVAFILTFLQAWIQLQIVKGNVELIDQLQNPERE